MRPLLLALWLLPTAATGQVFVRELGSGLSGPSDAARGPDGSLYAADTGNHRVVRFSAAGVFVSSWGGQGASTGSFSAPEGLAVDGAGNVYVADTGNDRVQKFTAGGTFLLAWGSSGSAAGLFSQPKGVAAGPSGDVYVADAGNSRIQVFGASGALLRSWGSFDFFGSTGTFSQLQDLALDEDERVYTTDQGGIDRVQVFTSAGLFVSTWAAGGSGTRGVAASQGRVFVSDTNLNRVRVFDASGTSQGDFGAPFPSGLLAPRGLVALSSMSAVVADTLRNRLVEFGPLGPVAGGYSVTSASASLVWASSFPAGTAFSAELSTDSGFAALFASLATSGTSAGFAGLSPNTRYHARVSTGSAGGPFLALGSAVTPAQAPGTPAWTSVGSSSGLAAWSDGGNPSGTSYRVEASTAADFSGFKASSATSDLSATLLALTPNATWELRVLALNLDGAESAPSAGASTVTLAAVPLALAPVVSSHSVEARWDGAGNPGDTAYEVELATDASFSPSTTTTTASTSTAFSGLDPAAGYRLRVRAADRLGRLTAYADLGAAVTLAPPPAGAALLAVTTFSAAAAWTAVSTGSGYALEASTDGFASALSSATADLARTTLTVAGLVPNTTYAFRVGTLGPGAASYSGLGSSATLAAAPAAGSLLALSTGSLRAAWGAAGNPGGTLYALEADDDPGFGSPAAASTASLSLDLDGLLPNTTYHLRVRAAGHGGTDSAPTGLGSAATLSLPPGGAQFLAVGATEATVGWTALPASPSSASAQGYRLEASTDGFATALASATSDLAQTALTVAGLPPGTSAAFRVGSLNHAGLANFGAALSTATAAAPPLPAGPPTVGTGTVTVAWQSGGNPAGAQYEAQLDTEPAFGSPASVQTSALSASFGGLEAGTAHHLRVRALPSPAFVGLGTATTLALAPAGLAFSSETAASFTVSWSSGGNPDGTSYRSAVASSAAGAFADEAVSTQTARGFAGLTPDALWFVRVEALNPDGVGNGVLGSSRTLAAEPVPGGVLGVDVGSITVSWGGGGNPASTVYELGLATVPSFSPLVLNPSVAGLQATFAGLSPDTTHHLRLRAVNGAGAATAYVSLGSTATLPAAPASVALTAVSSGSVSVSWDPNGNPAGSRFQVQLSTDEGFGGALAVSTTAASEVLFAGLVPLTTHHARVRVLGHGGAPSAFVAASPAATPGAPVAPGLLQVATGSLSASWSDGLNPAGTFYDAELSLQADFLPVLASSRTAALQAVFGALSPNTTYHARVGAGGALAALGAAATLAVPPAGLPDSLSSVFSSSLTVRWSSGAAGAFNPSGTLYEAQLSTAADFSAGAASAAASSLSVLFTGLQHGTTYHARVRAVGHGGQPTAFAALGSVLSSAPPAAASLSLSPAAPASLPLTGPSGPILVEIPAQAFAGPVTLQGAAASAFPAPVSPAVPLAGLGVGVELSAQDGSQPQRALTLTLTYRDSDLGGRSPSQLSLARYSEPDGAWALLPSAVDAAARTVSAPTAHLSLFQLMAVEPSASVESARAYPNPFLPARGHVELRFAGLPLGAKVSLYTILGEKVRELAADGTGTARWDGRTEAGRAAATGVYVALIEAGGERTTLKVAVQR